MTEIEKGIELTLKVLMKVKDDEIAQLRELFQTGLGSKDHVILLVGRFEISRNSDRKLVVKN